MGRGGTPSPRIALSGDRLIVSAGWEHWLELRRIAGGEYNKTTQDWSFPLTRETVWRLSLLLPVWSPEAQAAIGLEAAALAESKPTAPEAGAKANTTAPEAGAVTLVPPREDQTFDPGLGPLQRPAVLELPPVPTVPDLHQPLPPIRGLRTQPWGHQIAAFWYALSRLTDPGAGGALLAMFMGTGKTLVSILLMIYLGCRRTLVVAPLRVVPVWPSQIAQHSSEPVVIATLDDKVGTVRERVALAKEKLALAKVQDRPLVVCVNYEAVYRDEMLHWLTSQTWDLIIADECHRIKMPGGKASLAFKKLRLMTRARLGLSGTPMPHSLLDIYAIARFLDWRIFGDSNALFKSLYAIYGGLDNRQVMGFANVEHFERQVARFMFRVDKSVLDLPPVMHQDYECELSKEAREIYRDLEKHFVADIAAGTITAANGLVKMLRLQQLSSGSVRTDDGHYHRVDTAKAQLLEDLLEDIEPAEPVVVFCQFTADLDIVAEIAQRLERPALELSGRADDLARWQQEKPQAGQNAGVLAVQIKAGGTGVDLTRSRYGVYFSLSSSLGDFDQSLSRLDRPGQLRSVLYLHLITRGTVDVRIRRALARRAEVVGAVLDEIRQLVHQPQPQPEVVR